VERALKEWWRGNRGREDYRRERREYREICERKRREENEEWLRVAREARTQKQVWMVINRERRRKVGVNKEIRMEEWDRYFKGLLGGSERKGGRGGGGLGEREGEEEMVFEEVERAIGKLKKGKAAGEDGILNEA